MSLPIDLTDSLSLISESLVSNEKIIAYITNSEDEYFHKNVAVINHTDLDVGQLANFKIVVLNGNESSDDIIRSIRRSDNPEIYLKPVCLRTNEHFRPSKYLLDLVDGVLGDEDLFDIIMVQTRDKFEEIESRIREIINSNLSEDKGNANIPFKILRYIYTRDMVLKPILTSSSLYGYIYPLVDVNFPRPTFREFDILDYLEIEQLLKGSFIDKLHFCNFCHSSFLNFREVCSHCGHGSLKIEDITHHFLCGYIGPESDFRKTDRNKLICPKCHKHVKHIGVDYDRPSVVYTCNDCERNFQEPEIDCICVNCEKKTPPENLINRDIKEYKITSMGQRSALSGLVVSAKELLKEDIGLLDQETFKIILDLEIKRKDRFENLESSAGIVTLENFNDIYVKLGSRAKDVIQELSKIFKQHVSGTDVISSVNHSVFILLFVDSDMDDSQKKLGKIKAHIQELINENLDISMQIGTSCIQINENLGVDQTIEILTDNA